MVKMFLIKRLIDSAQTLAAQGQEGHLIIIPGANHQPSKKSVHSKANG